MYELFGTNVFGLVEYLGSFGQTKHILNAVDEYEGMNYTNLKYCLVR